MGSDSIPPPMVDEVADAEANVEVVRELVAFFRAHAEELRQKGLPIDDMIRQLEAQVEEVLAAAKKVHDLRLADEFLTKKREHLRRGIDEMLTRLPPDLVDGMATSSYLAEMFEQRIRRKREGRKKMGG